MVGATSRRLGAWLLSDANAVPSIGELASVVVTIGGNDGCMAGGFTFEAIAYPPGHPVRYRCPAQTIPSPSSE